MKIDRVTLALAKKYTDEHGGGGGTSNYNSLSNKPKINSVELSGNKSLSDLGVPLDTSDLTNGAGFITANDIPADVSAFNNDAGYITKSVNDLTNYTTTANMNTALGLKQNVILASALPIGGTTQTTVEGALGALNTAKIDTSDKGVAGGVAELDNTGKVPSSQLPSYVDDVVDGYYNENDGKFYEESTYTTEIAGEAGKIYISVDTDLQYRWTGSAFAAMGGALVLGETSSTAYRGDRGKTAYDDSQTNKTAIGTMANLTTTEKGSLVGAINEVAGRSTGHVIKDGGTTETERTGLNFIDHDITDDSTNDNTDVAPHELTSAEWADIMPVLPGINSGGLIFDGRETEHVVGKYINAQGQTVPVYQKTFAGTIGSKNTDTTIGTISNFRGMLGASGVVVRANGRNDAVPSLNTLIAVASNGTVTFYHTVDAYASQSVIVVVQYTKSTDTPV